MIELIQLWTLSLTESLRLCLGFSNNSYINQIIFNRGEQHSASDKTKNLKNNFHFLCTFKTYSEPKKPGFCFLFSFSTTEPTKNLKYFFFLFYFWFKHSKPLEKGDSISRANSIHQTVKYLSSLSIQHSHPAFISSSFIFFLL